MIRLSLLLLLSLASAGASAAGAVGGPQRDVDREAPTLSGVAGMDAMPGRELITALDPEALARWGHASPFLRIRGLPDPTKPEAAGLVAEERKALAELQAAGFRLVPIIEWSLGRWAAGTRPGGGRRVGLDLREAFMKARAYADAYSSQPLAPSSQRRAPGFPLGFEFENEPDISFLEDNPETYAAFLKACWLGVHDAEQAIVARDEGGAAGGDAANPGPASQLETPGSRLPPPSPPCQLAAPGSRLPNPSSQLRAPVSPRVVMAPVALPPGPYFEQLVRNGFLSYTDTFNYHFYGYAEDFTGVYRQFEDAVATASRQVANGKLRASSSELQAPSFRLRPRTLPVILTEYGYGHLDRNQRNTVAGRVQQWAWFRDVARQIEDLRIAGPMAFYLPPYLEHGAFEFGLTMAAPEGKAKDVRGKPRTSGKAKDVRS